VDEYGPHVHGIKVRSKTPVARRIDVHPFSQPKLVTSDVVYFVIEGCIKADSVLAAGGAVFSVPSVSLWDCDELERFALEYLHDKTVFIVADADWNANDMVKNQARMCQATLHHLGVPETHIAAPPSFHNGKETKGVDDFIGAGGALDELIVIDSKPPEGIRELLAVRGLRKDRIERDADVLWAMSAYSGPTGVFACPLSTLARVMRTYKMRVSRAVKSLAELGVLTVSGDLSVRSGWFSNELDWTERPIITLAPELRSVDKDAHLAGETLRDINSRSLRNAG
jgi:hypothetical protein